MASEVERNPSVYLQKIAFQSKKSDQPSNNTDDQKKNTENDFWILKCKEPGKDHFQWYKVKIKKIFRLFGFTREWEERNQNEKIWIIFEDFFVLVGADEWYKI